MKRQGSCAVALVLAGMLCLPALSVATEDTWTYKADISTPRTWAGGCVLDGRLYVVGGGRSDSSATSAVEAYDPSADAWTGMPPIPSARCYPAVCAVHGKIYVFGGAPGVWATADRAVFVFDPQAGTWTRKADMPYALAASGAALVGNTVYLMGGALTTSSPPARTVMAYDPATESWTQKADMPTARECLSVCSVNGKIYAIGGCKQDWQSFAYKVVEIYDPATDTWDRKADMPTGRWSLGACVVDGKIHVIGGCSNGLQASTANEVYDPRTDTWTAKAPMQQKRLGHVLGLIGSQICVAGGHYPNLTLVARTEMYDTGFVSSDPCEATAQAVDFDGSERIDFGDFCRLALSWRDANMVTDIAPWPAGDGIVDFSDLLVLAKFWLHEAGLPIYITWLGHASVKIVWTDHVIYVDPYQLADSPHDATLILVTHSHSDHYSPSDIAKITNAQTQFIGAADVVQMYGKGQAIAPGQTIQINGLSVTGVAMYNITKTNHPKDKNWTGFVVQIGRRRIYLAGDTDLTPEMKALTDIDVAFLPAGGTYTMAAAEAAEATKYLKPTLAIPYHWGTIVGTKADAEKFVSLAACNAKVMAKGETISSDDWDKDFSIAAYWKLDETTGDIARDSNGSNHAALNGGPVWRPEGGKAGGALEFDGVDDYVDTPFVLNPSAGSFSAFAWVKDGAPGQVILSQSDGANWLVVDASDGAFSTELKGSGRTGKPLKSAVSVADGEWHHAGLVLDGTSRILYLDGVQVAKDSQSGIPSSTAGLYIGASSTLAAGTFWSGLIDDVCIYSRVVKP